MTGAYSVLRGTLAGSVTVTALLATSAALAQLAPPGTTVASEAAVQVARKSTPNTAPRPATTESIVVRAQRRLLREKDSPSAVTELGTSQIAQTGVQGSVATLLRAAPSVYVYQQGIGNNEPVLSIRGTRGLETAQTLDDVPMQDLLYGGSGAFLQNIIGGRFSLEQISGVSIYPGVAYPDKNTFGTIGGTIAYASLRPSPKPYIDVTGSIGSFGTYNEGIELNSGAIDSPLGTGDNALRMILKYSNLQTNGFIDYTPAKYNNVFFALDKPYDGGLSKLQATIIYNTANGLITPEPVPIPYLNQNGLYSNYSPDQEFSREQNDFLTILLRDDTYINDYLNVGLSTFYLNSDSTTMNYGNPSIFSTPGVPGSVTVGGASPFNQTPAGFGQQGDYGPGSIYYQPPVYTYDGAAAYSPGTGACPASVAAAWAGVGQASPCGYNALASTIHNDTYGIQPRATITLPEYFGVANTIKVGGLAAKETQPNPPYWFGGTSTPPRTAANLTIYSSGDAADGGVQRTIYQGYLQDKIDLLHNTLHLTPGGTLEGTSSSYVGGNVFGGTPSASALASPYCQAGNPCKFGSFQQSKWDRDLLPFFNVSYDLDRVLPAAKGVSLYASYGESALFAPVSDFSPNLLGAPPSASIVHMYEGGVKYNVSNLVLSADYFYQKVDRDFGFFTYQSGPLTGDSLYTNDGQREFKGVEAAATWQVNTHWQLFANVSHTLAKYLATTLAFTSVQEEQFGIALRGKPITGIPDWLSTFGVDYNHHDLALAGDALNVRFEGQYTGKQQTSYYLSGYENIGPLPGVTALPGSYGYYEALAGQAVYDPNGGINPFVIFNLDANYRLPVQHVGPLKTISFDLNVLNLFNNQYFQYYYRQVTPTACGVFKSGPFKGQQISGEGCTPQFADGLPGEPFAITFTATAHF
ncbi:TonB-dependent receptor [Lichenicoccus sp.]|uniref:TonB-dependent receptor n=1 Tax=Lichenicoccus sp. TaxID=2781899 RepID=UPI003D125BE8